MEWKDISPPWQACIEEAWAAYCHGSLPHGAVVTDGQGSILSRGRNCVFGVPHRSPIAHAEMGALSAVEWIHHPLPTRGEDILYATIEPCDMCMGAVLAAHLRQIRFLCRDTIAGASNLVGERERYKHVVITGPQTQLEKELEVLLVALQLDAVLHMPPMPLKQDWAKAIAAGVPEGERLGNRLYERRLLVPWKENKKEASFVVNELSALLHA